MEPKGLSLLLKYSARLRGFAPLSIQLQLQHGSTG